MSGRKDYKEIILYDLEALKDCFLTRNKKDFDYHFSLLKGNLKDYFKRENRRRKEVDDGNRSKKS